MKISFNFLIFLFFAWVIFSIICIIPVHFHDLNDYTGLISARFLSNHPLDIIKINNDLELSKNPLLYLFSYYRPLERLVWTVIYSLWHDNPLPYSIFSSILFLGIVFNLYILGRYLSGKWAGFFTACIFATLIPGSYHIITYRTNMNFALEIYFLTLALFFIFSSIKEKKEIELIIGIFFALMAYLSKESSMYVVPIVTLFFILAHRRNVEKNMRIMVMALIFCFFSIILFYNSRFLSHYKADFIENPGFFINIKFIIAKLSYFKTIYANLGFVLSVIIFISIFLRITKKYEYILTSGWFLAAFLPLFLFPVISDAYLLDSFIPLSLIGGVALGEHMETLTGYRNEKKRAVNFKYIASFIFILTAILAVIFNAARLRWTIKWAEKQRSKQMQIINTILSAPYKDIIFVKDGTSKEFYKAMLQFYNREDIKIEIKEQ